MRDFAKIEIDDAIGTPSFVGFKADKIVHNTLTFVSNMILEEDRAIIATMKGDDVEKYINVETYWVLHDYLWWIDETMAEKHTGVNCPVCAKKEKVIHLIHCLISRWVARGKKREYEEAARFRELAVEPGRVLN